MKNPQSTRWPGHLVIPLLTLALAGDLVAQFGGGATRTQSSRSGRTGTSAYYPSQTELGSAIVEVDPETRSLIIITDEETNLEIDKVVRSLDRPKPQVLIKVLFLEVTHSDDLDLGVEGSIGYQHDGINSGTVETIWGLADQVDGGFWTLAGDDWQVTLRAIARTGKLEVLSRPSILARNNQEAVILVGSEVPFITNSRITDQGQTINTIQYSEVGIILRVTPFITSEGWVEMIVAPEISTLTEETVPISETVSSPVIAKRSAETVVVTPDSKTVVIGGLMENIVSEAKEKVPVLGDIPLLGFAFRRTVKLTSKKELLIFLTPYIIQTPERLEAVSSDEARRTELAPQAFTEKDLDKFLDGARLRQPPPEMLQEGQP